MDGRNASRSIIPIFVLAAALWLTAVPAAAVADTDPAEFEFHAADLLDGGSEEITGQTIRLAPEGTATEGESLRIELDESERDAFEITSAAGSADGIGVAVDHTAEAIEIEFTNLGGNGNVTGAEIDVTVSLRATDDVASDASTYDSTAIASVDAGTLDLGLDGEDAIAVSIVEAAEIGFTAGEIDENVDGSMHEVNNFDQFSLTFAKESVLVADGDSINLSVNPEAIKDGDEDGIGIRNVAKWAIQGNNISQIDISESNNANVLDGHTDQLTITIHTVDGEPKLISKEIIAVNIQLVIDKEALKYAANRYHNADFLEVDVEGEDNEALTDNADIRTESPLLVDIYPSEIGQFEFGGPTAGEEISIAENRTIEIVTAQDKFGNEIRQPTFRATLSGAGETHTYDGIRIDTNERDGLKLGRDGDVAPRLGVFDLTVEVTNIEGPTTHGGGEISVKRENLTFYPDDVRVRAVGPNDFDADGGVAELAVDLGVRRAEIGRVDIELRRINGSGTVTVNRTGGTPTETDLWKNTQYDGDGEMRPENAWVIERDLTAADFGESGVRTYALEADTADRYKIAAEAMPYEGRLVANESEVATSTAEAHDEATRGTAEIVATGPIDAVSNVSVRTDREFVGVEADEGEPLRVDFGSFLDANGNVVSNTDETVSIGLGNETIEGGVGSGSVNTKVGPSPSDPSATVAFESTEIDATAVQTGSNATVAIEFDDGWQRNETNVTLVHRVTEPDAGGWRAGSMPQPATLYVDADGPRDLTQWDPATERYESPAETSSTDVFERDRIEAEDLHRGFYFRSADPNARLGFDFATDSEVAANETGLEETVTLEPGWHLESSNYDISEHARLDLAEDVNWTGYGFGEGDDAFVVHNGSADRIHDRTNGSDIDGATAAIEHDDAYWIRVRSDDESPLVRAIVSSTFTETDGVQG